MVKLSKKQQTWRKKFAYQQEYSLEKAVQIITANHLENFNATLDLVFVLNLDMKKSEHTLKGIYILPYPKEQNLKICVFTEHFVTEAKKQKPFLLGGKELIAEIAKTGKVNFDLVLATPEMMPHLSKVAKILGPKKLMPSTKTKTVGQDIEQMMSIWKQGQTSYHTDNYGNLHLSIGKVQDNPQNMIANFTFCYQQVLKIKPLGVKGRYIKGIYLHSTMGPSFKIKFISK